MNKKILALSIIVLVLSVFTFNLKTYSAYKKELKPVNIDVKAAGFNPDVKIENILTDEIKPVSNGQTLANFTVSKGDKTDVNVEYEIIVSSESKSFDDFKIGFNGEKKFLKNNPSFNISKGFSRDLKIHWPKKNSELFINEDLLNIKEEIDVKIFVKQTN